MHQLYDYSDDPDENPEQLLPPIASEEELLEGWYWPMPTWHRMSWEDMFVRAMDNIRKSQELHRQVAEPLSPTPITLSGLIEVLGEVEQSGALETMRRHIEEHNAWEDDRSPLSTEELNRLKWQKWRGLKSSAGAPSQESESSDNE